MKKIIISLSILLLCHNSTIGQNTLDTTKTPNRNFIVVIEEDSFALVPQADIILSKQKYLQDEKTIALQQDSIQELIAIIETKNKEIKAQNVFIAAKDTTYYTLKRIYSSLQKDYTKIQKSKLLSGIIGGGVSTNYAIESKHFTSVALNVNLGLMFKQKYITTLGVGFNLNREIVFGLNTSMVF